MAASGAGDGRSSTAQVRRCSLGHTPPHKPLTCRTDQPWAWAKEPSIGNKTINVRAESVTERPAFKAAFRSRRCVILASGFYEWRRGGGPKRPFLIRPKDGEPLGFAGLWEAWRDP